MAIRQDIEHRLEAQLAVWQGQIKDYQERMAQAQADARGDYERSVAQMRENAEETKKLLDEVRQANEAAWKDMQTASQRSFEQLQKGWADALGRFA